MNLQLTALPNPLVAELLELEAGTPVRLTFGTTTYRHRPAGSATFVAKTVPDAVEGYYTGLGNLWHALELRDDQPLAVRYRPASSVYDSGRTVAELTAVEVLEHLTAECSTCKTPFAVTTKIRPRECPACAKATADAGAVAKAAYKVGAAVAIHAFGHWYEGKVVKIGRTNVTVRYTTGTGVTRDKSVNPAGDLLRPRVAR